MIFISVPPFVVYSVFRDGIAREACIHVGKDTGAPPWRHARFQAYLQANGSIASRNASVQGMSRAAAAETSAFRASATA